jgi:HMG (high mobility group) box
MQNPGGSGKGRRGTPASGKGGARPSPAPKPPRDPNAPKRPTNPFLRFCEQERDNVRALHSNDDYFDLTKAMGVAWHELDDEQKQPYKDAFNEDQKRYKEDMAVYEAMKRRSSGSGAVATVTVPRHSHQHQARPHQPSSRSEKYASHYGDEVESEDGRSVAMAPGRESPDPMEGVETGSNADAGTPGGASTPGPSGASGFTAVNRRSGGLDANMFKREE